MYTYNILLVMFFGYGSLLVWMRVCVFVFRVCYPCRSVGQKEISQRVNDEDKERGLIASYHHKPDDQFVLIHRKCKKGCQVLLAIDKPLY